ncbi:hypothetical protein TSA6c_00105 [Azospirillum sp. TSA6c]|uniref:HNH endonuclease n=1 Tax=Azospirillum sp. TSA6c TaxID=709813 RepID=UPI000D61561C|nr:HNH endonuclease [Azospirillum sp. TSA6c]PWC54682.1 hypothetical protein TSA6c_00105 [Azospirillum sp. TSA6c]
MTASNSELTQARLRDLLTYDPQTGIFTWRVDRGTAKAGQAVSCVSGAGYVQIRIDGKRHSAHRLAFLWMTGNWPDKQVDHINRDRVDNRWGNLRLANSSQNLANRPLNRNNTSGVKGVCWDRRDEKWSARIRANGKRRFLGCFSDINDAAAAYDAAAKQHFGDFANPVKEASHGR